MDTPIKLPVLKLASKRSTTYRHVQLVQLLHLIVDRRTVRRIPARRRSVKRSFIQLSSQTTPQSARPSTYRLRCPLAPVGDCESPLPGSGMALDLVDGGIGRRSRICTRSPRTLTHHHQCLPSPRLPWPLDSSRTCHLGLTGESLSMRQDSPKPRPTTLIFEFQVRLHCLDKILRNASLNLCHLQLNSSRHIGALEERRLSTT